MALGVLVVEGVVELVELVEVLELALELALLVTMLVLDDVELVLDELVLVHVMQTLSPSLQPQIQDLKSGPMPVATLSASQHSIRPPLQKQPTAVQMKACAC